jgi:hypothetical protein
MKKVSRSVQSVTTQLVLILIVLTLYNPVVNAANDFTNNRIALDVAYPTRDSTMVTMSLEKDVILLAEAKDSSGNPTGRFDFCADVNCTNGEAGNSQWGAVALLSYWWSKNGQNNTTVANAAKRGLAFAIANRHWTDDPSDKQYLRKVGTGYANTRYYLNNNKPIGNYPSTAWALIYKAMILRWSGTLFSTADRSAVEAQARSNWLWISRASKYNPQNTANQTMGAILGAYMLGSTLNDTALKNEALAYYETGVANTNMPPSGQCGTEPVCGGYRNVARISIQGYEIFNEQGGFDTHYGAMHLSFHAALFFLMGKDLTSNVYLDAFSQAQYVRDRLSESGSMHGGTRHNEMGGSITDLGFALGLNFFSGKTNRDLGVARVANGVIDPLSPSQAMSYSQRAMTMILFNQYFSTWNTNKLTRNSAVGLRQGDVSIFFDQTNQPQSVSVNGTSFTEAVVENGVHVRGVYLQKSDGNWFSDQSTHVNTNTGTSNFTIRTAIGSMPDPSVDVKTRYITNGDALYIVNMIRFRAAASLRSANLMLGLPNFSNTSRLVKVYDATNANNFIDLSLDTGSLSAAAVRTGDVVIKAWPASLRVNNVDDAVTPAKARWMTSVNWNSTIEKIGSATYGGVFDPVTWSYPPHPNDTPRVWWNPKGNDATVRYTDYMRVNIKGSSTGDAYALGDVIVAVAKYASTGNADGFNVTPTFQSGSTFKVNTMLIEDATMSLNFGWSSGTFVDKASGQSIGL